MSHTSEVKWCTKSSFGLFSKDHISASTILVHSELYRALSSRYLYDWFTPLSLLLYFNDSSSFITFSSASSDISFFMRAFAILAAPF